MKVKINCTILPPNAKKPCLNAGAVVDVQDLKGYGYDKKRVEAAIADNLLIVARDEEIVPELVGQGNKSNPPISVWTHNPSDIQDKSLEDLNLMITNLDPDAASFDTPEEAVAFLSQDYQG